MITWKLCSNDRAAQQHLNSRFGFTDLTASSSEETLSTCSNDYNFREEQSSVHNNDEPLPYILYDAERGAFSGSESEDDCEHEVELLTHKYTFYFISTQFISTLGCKMPIF